MMNEERDKLVKHAQKFKDSLIKEPYKSEMQWFPIDDLNQESMTLIDTCLVGLTTVAHVQMSLQEMSSTKKTALLEIIQIIPKNDLSQKFALIIGNIDSSKSIFEGMLDVVLSCFELVNEYPWLLPKSRDPTEVKRVF